MRAANAQATDLSKRLGDAAEHQAIVAAATAVIADAERIEGELHNPEAKVVYDILRGPRGAQLYSQLAPLYSWSQDSDLAPSAAMLARWSELQGAAHGARARHCRHERGLGGHTRGRGQRRSPAAPDPARAEGHRAMIGWIRDKLFGWAQRLRFPWLLLLTAALFGIDLAIPDFIPFIDEIVLGLATLVLSGRLAQAGAEPR